jgi:hypothetical protein
MGKMRATTEFDRTADFILYGCDRGFRDAE